MEQARPEPPTEPAYVSALAWTYDHEVTTNQERYARMATNFKVNSAKISMATHIVATGQPTRDEED